MAVNLKATNNNNNNSQTISNAPYHDEGVTRAQNSGSAQVCAPLGHKLLCSLIVFSRCFVAKVRLLTSFINVAYELTFCREVEKRIIIFQELMPAVQCNDE